MIRKISYMTGETDVPKKNGKPKLIKGPKTKNKVSWTIIRTKDSVLRKTTINLINCEGEEQRDTFLRLKV